MEWMTTLGMTLATETELGRFFQTSLYSQDHPVSSLFVFTLLLDFNFPLCSWYRNIHDFQVTTPNFHAFINASSSDGHILL